MLADPTAPIDIAIAVKALVVVAAMLVVIALILKFWVRRISMPCQFCRNVRVNPLRELPRDVRNSILAYFRDYEGRDIPGWCTSNRGSVSSVRRPVRR